MTTNCMGLEQALSDEQVKELGETLRSWQDGYDPIDDKEQYQLFANTMTALNELLARRDASRKPVADVVAWNKPGEERKCDIRWRRFDVAPGPLFEAPPLQAVTDGWVKCSERMPTIGDRDIWIWNGEYAHSGYVWDGNAFVDWNEEYEELKGVTHWMPMELPAAPQR